MRSYKRNVKNKEEESEVSPESGAGKYYLSMPLKMKFIEMMQFIESTVSVAQWRQYFFHRELTKQKTLKLEGKLKCSSF